MGDGLTEVPTRGFEGLGLKGSRDPPRALGEGALQGRLSAQQLQNCRHSPQRRSPLFAYGKYDHTLGVLQYQFLWYRNCSSPVAGVTQLGCCSGESRIVSDRHEQTTAIRGPRAGPASHGPEGPVILHYRLNSGACEAAAGTNTADTEDLPLLIVSS